MPTTPSAIQGSDPLDIAPLDKSIHFHQVKKAIPAWLLNTSPSRVDDLKSVRLTLPDWHRKASTLAHRKLKKPTSSAGPRRTRRIRHSRM